MDFNIGDTTKALQEKVRSFVAQEIVPYAKEMDRDNGMRPGLVAKAAELGLLNLIVPKEFGGAGLDPVSVAVLYEEIAKGCAGVATTFAANSLATLPVLLDGNDEQKQDYFEVLNKGGLAAFALTEPQAGSDAGAGRTRANSSRAGRPPRSPAGPVGHPRPQAARPRRRAGS